MEKHSFVLKMRKLVVRLVLACLLFGVSSVYAQQDDVVRLDFHLDSIESKAKAQRYMRSAINLGLSGLLGVGAMVATRIDESDPIKKASIYTLATSSVVLGLSGFWTMLMPSDFETLPSHYRLMPENNVRQVKTKKQAGEVYLRRLAQSVRRQRFVGSLGYTVLGLSEIALYASSLDQKANSWLFYQGALITGMGVYKFYRKENAEIEFKTYMNGHSSGLMASLFFN
jgi:hypothetical protein